jgi:hypothetical protein
MTAGKVTTLKRKGLGGARPGAGRPRWEPVRHRKEISPGMWREESLDEAWERVRQGVRHYVAIGYPQEVVARIIEPAMSVDTLAKHFRYELDNGKLIQDAKVAGTAYYLAVSGREPSMTRFWLRSRMGWRDVGPVRSEATPIRFQIIEGDDW